MTVYFLRPGTRRVVKIGFTAGNAAPRMKTAQTYSPDEVRILAAIPGGKDVEARLHRQFQSDRIRREWFRLSPEVRHFLNSAGTTNLPDDITAEAQALSRAATKVITLEMFDDGAREYLLSLAEIYGRVRGLSLATISRLIHGNCKFLRRYSGKECSVTLTKYEEMVGWFRDNWPDGILFPELTILWDQVSRKPRDRRSAKKALHKMPRS